MKENENPSAEITDEPWTTSRTDIQSFTENEETGEVSEVVYVYREGEPRIPFFGEYARERAEALAELVNANLRARKEQP